MSSGYRFRMGEYNASLIVAIPLWAEILPLHDLTYVRLEVEGHVLYEEGHPPNRPLRWTDPAGAFPVIPMDASHNLPLPPPPLPAPPPPLNVQTQ
jgi:hypothetical protein